MFVAAVFAVELAIAAPHFGYADAVAALEVVVAAVALLAIELVRAVATLGLSVANPRLWNATIAIGALEPVRAAAGPSLAGLLVASVWGGCCNWPASR